MCSEIAKHASYIEATIHYIRNGITTNPILLSACKENKNGFIKENTHLLKSTKLLHREMHLLQSSVNRLVTSSEYHSFDLITFREEKKWKLLKSVVKVSCIFLIVKYRKDIHNVVISALGIEPIVLPMFNFTL